jgi:hypothetical protein
MENMSTGYKLTYPVIKITTNSKLILGDRIVHKVPANTYLVNKSKKLATVIEIGGDYIELDKYLQDLSSYLILNEKEYLELKSRPTIEDLTNNIKKLIEYYDKNRKDTCETRRVTIGVPKRFENLIDDYKLEISKTCYDKDYFVSIYFTESDFEIVPYGKI